MRRAYGRDPRRWTQPWLAQQAAISQQAVSKATRAPGQQSIEEQTDPAYLVGRLLGIANVATRYGRGQTATALERTADKMVAEKLPITAETLRQLRRLLAARVGGMDAGRGEMLRAALADVDTRLEGQDMPSPLPGDNKTRVRLLLGFDHQRAALKAERDAKN